LRRNRKSPVLCPICHIVRSQWDEPLAAARPHGLGFRVYEVSCGDG
jgi:hypothetical protein